jgi:signal recognition particle subunit SRP54
VGLGEKLDKFEAFHPDRMADRILGMGDVVGLVEKAQAAIEEDEAQALEEKIRRNTFDLEDFRKQLKMIKRIGSIRDLLGHLPFFGSKMDGLDVDESQLNRIEAVINSMTPGERAQPEIIGASRRQRIAIGSGTDPVMVNQLLKQFRQMKKMLHKLSRGNMDALAGAMPPGMEDMLGKGGPGGLPGGGRGKRKK